MRSSDRCRHRRGSRVDAPNDETRVMMRWALRSVVEAGRYARSSSTFKNRTVPLHERPPARSSALVLLGAQYCHFGRVIDVSSAGGDVAMSTMVVVSGALQCALHHPSRASDALDASSGGVSTRAPMTPMSHP